MSSSDRAAAGDRFEARAGEIRRLATELAQVQSRLTELIDEVNQDEEWRRDGAASAASWLVAQTSISHGTAYTWVEVAEGLPELPAIGEAFSQGRLSFDQVRILVRFAEADDDAELAEIAETESVNQLQRRRRRRERFTPKEVGDAHATRSVRWWREPRLRQLILQAILPEEDGAALIEGIERLVGAAPRDPESNLPAPIEHRRADALVQLASQRLGADSDPDRATVVVHVDAPAFLDESGTGEFANGGLAPIESIRRMACDGRIELILERDGKAIGVGRATRRIPAWLARQIRHRDGGCRFPGCERQRWVHIHHMVHWIDGGPTDLDCLVTLCDYHHRLVHERGWHISGDPNRDLIFVRPDGSAYEPDRTRLRQVLAGLQQTKREFEAAVMDRVGQ